MIGSFLSVVILLYAFCLLFASRSWKNLLEIEKSGELKSVTILIPFRNEAKNLEVLLKSLYRLEYPQELLEVILIDDHSEDDFTVVYEQFQKASPYKISLKILPIQLQGKKSAIMEGVRHSNAEIILCSDADCIFPSDWVVKMQAPFEISSIQLVSGNVVFQTSNFLSRIFQMEFAPLIGVGAVSIDIGRPNMANGANLAFRKATFENLKPYEDNMLIPSGDDVFLIRKIQEAYPGSIFFQKNAVVETKAPVNLTAFYSQRIRWAAKWKASSKGTDSLFALMIWIFHCLYLASIIYAVLENQFLVFLPFIFLKVISEGIFISLILRSQRKKMGLAAFVTLQIFYSAYVIIFGLLANFGTYSWKDRKYNNNERAGN